MSSVEATLAIESLDRVASTLDIHSDREPRAIEVQATLCMWSVEATLCRWRLHSVCGM